MKNIKQIIIANNKTATLFLVMYLNKLTSNLLTSLNNPTELLHNKIVRKRN